MANENVMMTKMVRGQLARRPIDTSLLNIQITGTTVYFVGVLRAMRDHANIDLREEMNHISTILRQKGIREVVWEVSLRS